MPNVTTIDTGIHFIKSRPAVTTQRQIIHCSTSGSSTSGLLYNDNFGPSGGDWSALFTDTTYCNNAACLSSAPDYSILYSNLDGVYVWDGIEARTPFFAIGDSTAGTTNTFNYDFTSAINNDNPGVVATLYQASDNKVYIYIGCIRPIYGVHFYVGNPNPADAATTAVNYWNGTAWTAVSGLSDGTSVGGDTIQQSGLITWTDTVSVAKTYVYNNQSLYFYQFVITGFSGSNYTLTSVTTLENLQPIKDIWDGVPRPITSALGPEEGSIVPTIDYTAAVATQNYVPDDMTTNMDLHGFDGASPTGGHFVFGFIEPMAGLKFVIVGAQTNTATSSISYWNGSAWVALTITDGTSVSSATFNQSGWITWSPPANGLEQKKSYAGGPEFYYYKWTNNATFSAEIGVDLIQGLPVQKTIAPYALPTNWQNRTVLVGELGGSKPNSLLISSYGTTCVFNGQDSLEIPDIGDASAPTAVVPLFTRYTGQFFDTLVICKNKETWILDGTGVTNYHLYKLSDRYGCIAPETLRVVPVSYEIATGIARHVAIWLSASGVVVFDGNTIAEIDQDIKNYFQRDRAEYVSETNMALARAFVDEREREYHLLLPSGNVSALNTELVFSTKKKAWFKIDRSTNQLTCGFSVYSQLGVPYTFGGSSTGYVYYLENPATGLFDALPIDREIQTRDIPLNGWIMQTEVRYVKLIVRATNGSGTGNESTITHIGDGSLTPDNSTLVTVNSNCSVVSEFVQGKNWVNWGPHTFHSFKISASNGVTLAPQYEPVALVGLYKDIRLDSGVPVSAPNKINP